jgi:hypothetical protein
MAGGKGGGSTTSVEIPEYIERAAQRNLNKAEGISQIGYTPYYGPDVAAFTPSQQAAFQNTADSAGAFGMAAPTSQRDIMGGMDAPTTYANGVQGYSSAPMFEQSLDQLEANRPGQKNYIDSFFIDPFTGQAGSRVSAPVNYEDYMTSAESGRNEAEANRQNDLAMANAQASAGPQSVYNFTPQTDVVVGGTNVGVGGQSTQYYNPDINYDNAFTAESTNEKVGTLQPNQAAVDAMANEYGVDPNFYNDPNNPIYSSSDFPLGSSLSGTDYTTYSSTPNTDSNTMTNAYGSTVQIGSGIGQLSPTEAAAAGYSSTVPSSPASGGGFFGYDGVGDMLNGGGAGSDGDTYSGGGVVSDLGNSLTTKVDLPGNVISRALNIGAGKKDDSDDGYVGSSGDGTVLCTAYCNMGYLPREIYKLDRRYGVSLYRNDPSLILGYRKWATPIAEFIKTDTLAAKATRAVMWPIVKAWAEQMAHEMKPQKYSRNIAGKAIMLAGIPFSRLVGAVFVDKSVSKEAF